MKYLSTLLAILMLAISVTAFAARPELPKDGLKTKMNVHAPTATLGQILTDASTTVDMSDYLSWSLYAPAAGCKYRTMAAGTVGTEIQKTVPVGVWHTRAVRAGSAFTNFSSCALAELEPQ